MLLAITLVENALRENNQSKNKIKTKIAKFTN
jgi:uncharacterized protein YoaH (UPF0181 family)